jgi:putative phosphoesterase
MKDLDNSLTVAVISDTHAHLDSRVADIIKTCDVAVHAGDICGSHIFDEMQPKTGKIYAVTGNNDPYCHSSGNKLPAVLHFSAPGGEIYIEHGHKHGAHKPSHDSLRLAHPEAKVIIYGHTHKKVIDQEATPWIVNPGAAGNTRTHGGPSCLVIACFKDKEWEIYKHRFAEPVFDESGT